MAKSNDIAFFNTGRGGKNRRHFCFELGDNGCWNCTSHFCTNDGYPICTVNKKHRTVVRVLYEHIFGPIGEGKVLRHACDNPRCINPLHLLLGSHADNVADRVKRGRSAIGSNHGRAKLTENDVLVIRERLKYQTPTELAEIYNVDRRVIYQIRKGLTWNHVF